MKTTFLLIYFLFPSPRLHVFSVSSPSVKHLPQYLWIRSFFFFKEPNLRHISSQKCKQKIWSKYLILIMTAIIIVYYNKALQTTPPQPAKPSQREEGNKCSTSPGDGILLSLLAYSLSFSSTLSQLPLFPPYHAREHLQHSTHTLRTQLFQ